MSEPLRLGKLLAPALVISIGVAAAGCTDQKVAAESGSSSEANHVSTHVHRAAIERHGTNLGLQEDKASAYMPGVKSYAGCKPSDAWTGVYRPVSSEKSLTVKELDTYAEALDVPPSRVLGGTIVRVVCNGWDVPLFVKQHAAFTEWLAGDICLLTEPITRSGASEVICPEPLGP